MSSHLRSVLVPSFAGAVLLWAAMAVGGGGPKAPASAPATASASAGASSAGAEAEASARFRRGVELYREGDARAALIEFQRAYEIAPNYQVLFNLGQASAELKDYVGALKAFEKYMAEGGDAVPADRRERVRGEIEQLRQRVAKVTLQLDVADAEVVVDGVAVGHSPLPEALLVSAGRRRIVASKPGYVPLERYVDVGGGDDVALTFALLPVTAESAAPPASAARAEQTPAPLTEQAETNVGLWVSLATTGALAVATGILGGLALAAYGDYQDELDTFPSDEAALTDARDRVSSLALATDVLGAAAIGGVITTILFATLGAPSEPEASSEAGGDAAASAHRWPSAELRPGVGSLHVLGRF